MRHFSSNGNADALPGYEDGLAKTGTVKPEEATEKTDILKHLGRKGGAHQRSYSLLEGTGGLYVHARPFVSEWAFWHLKP